jgi:hypothetical protein
MVGLGEFLGGLGGFAAGALIFGTDVDSDGGRVMAGLTLGGLAGGFALATHLTRGMEKHPRFEKAASGQVSWAPTPLVLPGGGQGLGVVGTF